MVEGISREAGLPSPHDRLKAALARPELSDTERAEQARTWALGTSESRRAPVTAEPRALQEEPTDDPFSVEPLDHSGEWIGKDSE